MPEQINCINVKLLTLTQCTKTTKTTLQKHFCFDFLEDTGLEWHYADGQIIERQNLLSLFFFQVTATFKSNVA